MIQKGQRSKKMVVKYLFNLQKIKVICFTGYDVKKKMGGGCVAYGIHLLL